MENGRMTGDFGVMMTKDLILRVSEYVDKHYVGVLDEAIDMRFSLHEVAASASLKKKSMPDDLEDYINKKMSMGFQKRLFKFIDTKGMSDPEVYKRAGIDKRLFSKIRSNEDYKPSKQTVLSLCIALKLTLEESEILLEEAGYSLNNSSRSDLIVQYFLEYEIYNMIELNIVLEEMGEKVMGKF